jgi:drug/metabolite transporter (DMT)-like permease
VNATLAAAFGAAFASGVLAFGGAAMQASEARRVPQSRSLRLSLLLDLLRKPVWVAGTALNIVAFVVQVGALALASLAVVQPTLALGLVVLVAAAAWKLGERVERRALAGIGAIIVGLVGLAFVAPRHNHLPENASTAVVLGATLAVLVGGLAAMRAAGRRGGALTSVVAGLGYAWLSFSGTLVGEAFTRRSWGLVAGWSAATVVAAILAVGTEMTALQTWPVTRSKPVVFVLQTIVPALAAPFFSARGFGPAFGLPFGGSLLVVALGAAAVGSSGAVAASQAG